MQLLLGFWLTLFYTMDLITLTFSSNLQSVNCYGFFLLFFRKLTTSYTYIIQFLEGSPIDIIPTRACCGFLISYSLTQCSKSHCIKEGQNVDTQKWFGSIVSLLIHTNAPHFLILLTLSFWPTWSYLNNVHHHLHPLSQHFISTQNHFKSTHNHQESIPINLKHVKHLKSIIIYLILGIGMAFCA